MTRKSPVPGVPFGHSSWSRFAPLPLFLLCARVLSAASPSLVLQVSNETAPAGSFAQFKVSLTSPALIGSGVVSMDFDATVFGDISNVAVFSATGDAMGYANVSAQHVDAHFSSATEAIGQLPNLPVFVVSIPVLPGAAAGKTTVVTATASASPQTNGSGTGFAITVNPGSFTVGPSVAVASVTPGGGVIAAGATVQINGAGFDAGATVSIDDVSIASTQYVSPQQLTVMLGAQTEMTGKHVRVTGSTGSGSTGTTVDFFPSLPSAPTAPPAGFVGIPGVQPLVPLGAFTTGVFNGYVLEHAASTDGLAILNPNPTPVTVLLEISNTTPPQDISNQTITVAADSLSFFNATTLLGDALEEQLWIVASAPVRLLEYVYAVNTYASPTVATTTSVYSAVAADSSPPPIESLVTGGPVSWSWQVGTPPPSAVSLSVGGNLPFNVSVTGSAAPFLTVTPQQGTAPATLTVAPNLASATPGNYTGAITVTPTLPSAVPSLTAQPTSTAVTLVVSASSLLGVSSSSCCVFQEPVLNMPATGPDSLTVTSNGNPVAFTVTVGACAGGNWLSVTPLSGVTPATLTLTANPVGLNLPGGGQNYQCPVTIQGPSGTLALTAGLTVFGAPTPPGPAIRISPGYVTFQFSSGTAPAPQTVTVQSNGNPVTGAVQTQSGGNWLSAALTAGATDSLLTITVSSGLAPGAYTGAVTLSSPGLVSATVPITVTVLGLPPDQAPLTVTPSSLSVTGPAGSTQPVVCSIAAPGGIPVSFTLTTSTSDGGNWLAADSSSGITPSTLPLDLSAAQLAPGVYHGSVTIVWGDGSEVVPVTFTVTPSLASPPTTAAIVNGASLASTAISPGEIVTIFGSGTGAAVSGLSLAANGTVATTLAGTQVLINGTAAPLIYASPSQVNAIVPYEVGAGGVANIQVQVDGAPSAAWGIPLAASSPAIFTSGADGVGQGAALNQDNSVNGASNPAARGTVLQIYATGGGQTSPAAATGSVTKVGAQLALPVTVTIGGVNAQVAYAGSAPGEVEGVAQINAVVPAGVTPGAALPLLVTIGGVSSQAGVTVAVQ